jgi:hypothetical protein
LIDKLFVDATNKINGLVSASASAAAPVTAAAVPAVTSQTAAVTPVVPVAPVVAATPLIAATTTAAAQAQPEFYLFRPMYLPDTKRLQQIKFLAISSG